MTYAIIDPPLALRFHEMSKTELDAYWTWFHDVLPSRLAELARAVRRTLSYESWEPAMTPDSLEALGRWFENEVEVRKLTSVEMETVRHKLSFPIDIPDSELTNRTLSLCMDIGMYFAQVVLRNLPGTRWNRPLGSKRMADYGQPVIVGFGPVVLNPVRVIVMTAYGIAARKPAHLIELYNVWVGMKR